MKWSDAVFLAPEIVIALGASWLLLAPFIFRRSNVSAAKWQMLVVLAATVACVRERLG